MSALTNLLPVTTAPVNRPSPQKEEANICAERGHAATATSKARHDREAAEASRRGDEDKEKASAFAEVYEEELQEHNESEAGMDTQSSTAKSSPALPEMHSRFAAQLAGSHLADSGNPLPSMGESLPPPAMSEVEIGGLPVTAQADQDVILGTSTAVAFLSDAAPDAELIGARATTQTPDVHAQTAPTAIDFIKAAAGESAASPSAMVVPDLPDTVRPEQSQSTGTSVARGMTNTVDISAGSAASSAELNLSEAKETTAATMPGGQPSTIPGIATGTAQVTANDMIPIVAIETDSLTATEFLQSTRPTQDSATTVAPLANASSDEVPQQPLPVKNVETVQTSAAPITEAAVHTVWQSQVADRVRAWRGLSGADSTTNLTTQSATASSTQGRHEFAMTGSLGGQLQLFAESLRVAVNNPSPSTAVDTGAASTASTASVDASGAWRSDSAASTIAPSARAGTTGPTFQQTLNQSMPGSSFGQPLGQSFGQGGWAESLSQRVTMMAGQKVSSARIELDPPELGAMIVKITVTGDQASVNFTSANSMVRDALEQTFPRLQDLLGQQGLQLADANVSDNSAKGRNSGESGNGASPRGTASEADVDSATSHTVKAPLGLIDFYA